ITRLKPGALQNKKFTDKAVQSGQAERRHGNDGKEGRINRHRSGKSAQIFDHPGMAPFVDQTDDQKERSRADAMIDHHHHRAIEPGLVQAKNAEHAKPKVTEARIGHQFLHVGLHHRGERAVNDSDNRQADHPGQELLGRIGKEGKRKTHKSVRPHFQQDSGKNDRAGRGRFHVGIRQPRMEGEHRNFDRKADKECEKYPVLDVARQSQFHQRENVEGGLSSDLLVIKVKRQDAKQHQNGAEKRIQEKLDGRVKFSRPSPNSDQEVHGDEHHFPEDVEQNKIQRHKNAEHSRLKDQHENVVLLHAILNRAPGGHDGDKPQNRGQKHQQEADAVDSEEVLDAQRWNPVVLFLELHEQRIGPEIGNQYKRQNHVDECRYIRKPADKVLLVFGHKENQEN